MDRNEYVNIDAVNFSLLKLYMQSPAHFKFALDHPEEDTEQTKALMMGRAIHTLILEPEKFEKRFTFIDFEKRPVKVSKSGGIADYRTKENKQWKEFMQEAAQIAGQTMLDSKEDFEAILAMGESVRTNKAACALLKECHNEEVITWTDPESGVECKAIVDFNQHTEKYIHGDLKSMEDASPSSIGGYINKWLTHVQLAFYADGLEQRYGKPFNTAFIIAIEKKPPFICQPYFLDEEDLELGRTIYKSLLNMHKKCVESGKWGSYDSVYETINGVIVAKLPAWVKLKAEADEKLQTN